MVNVDASIKGKYMKVSFLFPGQGSQAIGMGKEFYDSYDIAKEFKTENVEVTSLENGIRRFSMDIIPL